MDGVGTVDPSAMSTGSRTDQSMSSTGASGCLTVGLAVALDNMQKGFRSNVHVSRNRDHNAVFNIPSPVKWIQAE